VWSDWVVARSAAPAPSDVGGQNAEAAPGAEGAQEGARLMNQEQPSGKQAGPHGRFGHEGVDGPDGCEELYLGMFQAAKSGRVAEVRQLLADGVDPNAGRPKFSETTVLGEALAHGHLAVARLLLDAGANPRAVSCVGATLLMHVAGCGTPDALRMLLDAATDISVPYIREAQRREFVHARNDEGQTALHYACAGNRADNVDELVRAGIDVGVEDGRGETARQLALKVKFTGLTQTLGQL
jgi:ankyrin repeat protein